MASAPAPEAFDGAPGLTGAFSNINGSMGIGGRDKHDSIDK
jgi:hypothetical protein